MIDDVEQAGKKPRLAARLLAPLGFLPARGISDGLLPWVLAVLVFLATAAILGGLSLNQSIRDWERDLSSTLTVLVLPDGERNLERDVETVIDILNGFPGVVEARALPDQEISSLLAPWLGQENLTDDLPVPRMIDVRTRQGASLDVESLRRIIGNAVPNAQVDDPGDWLRRLVDAIETIQLLAIGIVLLIGMVTAAIIVYATYVRMAIHRNIIEVVHLMGARDGLIAREFQWQFLRIGLKAGLTGALSALLVMWIVGASIAGTGIPMVPALRFSPVIIGVVVAIPVITSLMTMVTSNLTVRRALAEIVRNRAD